MRETPPALYAAICAVVEAAEPLHEAIENPGFAKMARDGIAVWALNKGFELTHDQVVTLAGALDLIMFALQPVASEARH
ncbi:hypothetical protein SAMN02799636_01098 [Methylobacterium sp. 275MFSha3.1]|uniref:hypothetical protein n=1 Tax=Methylobacterium sp. 275MFSha3.1 TaxID=1502746 RepID=UPI0008A76C77|nr:hypothetical protein [Methylobacterium sp. 275MFSha3.1]SEH31568.1 hypothetical protein SAMN02799636_01098 [Methylobacterium sp. 275MFSha3.1]